MTLKEKIHNDLISAMKAKEDVKLSVLRLLKAAIMKFEVSGDKKHEATDEEVMTIIGREVKQRKDSIEAYKKGGRDDLAKGEEAEMAVLQAYMPTQMSEDEVRSIVKEAVTKTGASSKADFGKVMGAVMPHVKGKADGQLVSKVVGEFLK